MGDYLSSCCTGEVARTADKGGATLISYAEGHTKLFDVSLRYGIDTDDVQVSLSENPNMFIGERR